MSPNNLKIKKEVIDKITERIAEELANPYGFSEYAELHFEIDKYEINLTLKEVK